MRQNGKLQANFKIYIKMKSDGKSVERLWIRTWELRRYDTSIKKINQMLHGEQKKRDNTQQQQQQPTNRTEKYITIPR